MNSFRSIIFKALALIAAAMSITSCSMMEDDRSDCPTGLYVRFVYDYNTERADMFKDQVGSVTLYVYDENGALAASRTVSNSASLSPLSQYGYTMHFTENELPAGKSYRLQAVAMQKDWDAALQTPGAKYRKTQVTDSKSLVVKLDRAQATVPGTDAHHVSAVAPLDTLWHTLQVMSYAPQGSRSVPEIQKTVKLSSETPYTIYPIEAQMVRVEHEKATYATVSLIRDTKRLNITLSQIDNPEDMRFADYEVTILDNNGTLGHDNALLADQRLEYTPWAMWNTPLDGADDIATGKADDGFGGVVDLEHAAHYDIDFNRLVLHAQSSDNARLVIRNVVTGHLVGEFDLAKLLLNGRGAFAIQGWGEQEYLDREHQYRLDFILVGGEWREIYVRVDVGILSWAKRIQNVELQ